MGRKRKRDHENSLNYAESKNGMITGAFHVPWHYDTGDGSYGITCCSNIPCVSKCFSFFCVVEYNLKISMDTCNSWCFFGGKVEHGTSPSKNLHKINFGNNIYYRENEKLLEESVTQYVNISWGQYTRAPPEVIYNRNCERIRHHELAVQSNDQRGYFIT